MARPRTAQGDSSTLLRDLFQAHGGYVWNTLRRLGVRELDLEDLTHDVFVQVQRRIDRYDPARPARPWLFAFAYRIASADRRRAHRRHEVAGGPDVAVHPGVPPDEALDDAQKRRVVAAALEGIELERRAVFVMYEIDGAGMAQIAEALRIPVNTAYSRLRVARREFAAAVKRLKAKGEGP